LTRGVEVSLTSTLSFWIFIEIEIQNLLFLTKSNEEERNEPRTVYGSRRGIRELALFSTYDD
jgi:hypothetical protein